MVIISRQKRVKLHKIRKGMTSAVYTGVFVSGAAAVSGSLGANINFAPIAKYAHYAAFLSEVASRKRRR